MKHVGMITIGIIAMILAMAPLAKADSILIGYDFTGFSLNPNPTLTAPGISGSPVTREPGGPNPTFGPGNPSPGVTTPGWNGGNDYYQIILNNNTPGTIFDITGVSVDVQSPNAPFGPVLATLRDGNGFFLSAASLSTSFATQSANGFDEIVNPGSSLTFRLFATGASSPSYAFNIDNFDFTGHSVPVQQTPEPSTLAFLGGALGLIAAGASLKNRRDSLASGNQESARQLNALPVRSEAAQGQMR
jgi:hypothetical protein